MTLAKRVIFVIGGVFWFLFSLGFGFVLVQYVAGGAGLQFFPGPPSSGSLLLGLVHLTGLVAAIVISFAIGAGLCACGLVSDEEQEQDNGRVSTER